jgi:hypothetical protein
MSTKPCKAFVAEESLKRLNASHEYVQAHIELLFIYKKWIFDISLNKVFMIHCTFWEVFK